MYFTWKFPSSQQNGTRLAETPTETRTIVNNHQQSAQPVQQPAVGVNSTQPPVGGVVSPTVTVAPPTTIVHGGSENNNLKATASAVVATTVPADENPEDDEQDDEFVSFSIQNELNCIIH